MHDRVFGDEQATPFQAQFQNLQLTEGNTAHFDRLSQIAGDQGRLYTLGYLPDGLQSLAGNDALGTALSPDANPTFDPRSIYADGARDAMPVLGEVQAEGQARPEAAPEAAEAPSRSSSRSHERASHHRRSHSHHHGRHHRRHGGSGRHAHSGGSEEESSEANNSRKNQATLRLMRDERDTFGLNDMRNLLGLNDGRNPTGQDDMSVYPGRSGACHAIPSRSPAWI